MDKFDTTLLKRQLNNSQIQMVHGVPRNSIDSHTLAQVNKSTKLNKAFKNLKYIVGEINDEHMRSTILTSSPNPIFTHHPNPESMENHRNMIHNYLINFTKGTRLTIEDVDRYFKSEVVIMKDISYKNGEPFDGLVVDILKGENINLDELLDTI